MQNIICVVGEMVIDFFPDVKMEFISGRQAEHRPRAVAAARIRSRQAFCGRMGNDDFGRFLANTLKKTAG